MDGSRSVTCCAPINIAVIKYWGKRDERLILPVNSSLSVTLGLGELCATTTVQASPAFTDDRLWLNGSLEPMSKRFQASLTEAKKLARKQQSLSDADSAVLDWHVHVCSVNNFPTAAGLASSAAGYACLAYCLGQLYQLQDGVSSVARVGSGSACRSVFGGFVAWEMGRQEDGSDSYGIPVAPESHWPELEVLVLVVSDQRKHTSSTAGMQTSVQTSQLLRHRADCIVPARMEQMRKAILERDFESFAKLTMMDSNQFHAVCLDTYPPIVYLNDVSRRVIHMATQLNKVSSTIKVAYTFDAGPNAVLFMQSQDVVQVLALCNYLFVSGALTDGVDEELVGQLGMSAEANSIQSIIRTKAGCGPHCLPDSQSLLNDQGLPVE